jgi:imidazolonepropionase-like amidohydrolase
MLSIINGKIVTAAGRDIDNGYIIIKDKIITQIGDMDKYIPADQSEIIDAKGMYVLPGFIDPHDHIGLFGDGLGFEGDDGNEATDPVTPSLRAIDGINHTDRCFEEAVQGGVTCVVTGPGSANVIGGQFAAVKTYGRCVDEMILKAPCAMKVAFGENPKTVYSEKKQAPVTRMATAAILRETLAKTKEYAENLKKYSDDPKDEDKPELDFDLESMLDVLNGKIPLKAHAHRADDILTAIRIAEEFGVRITIEHCTEGHIVKDILKEKDITVIVGPVFADRSKPELKNMTLRNAGILANEGIRVAIMTDHPVNPVQYLPICAALAVREGMDLEKALMAITINAAKACGIDDRVGSLEIGKDADLVILKGHFFDLMSKVMYTIINGKVVYSGEDIHQQQQ